MEDFVSDLSITPLQTQKTGTLTVTHKSNIDVTKCIVAGRHSAPRCAIVGGSWEDCKLLRLIWM